MIPTPNTNIKKNEDLEIQVEKFPGQPGHRTRFPEARLVVVF